jgi:hypothetical protein
VRESARVWLSSFPSDFSSFPIFTVFKYKIYTYKTDRTMRDKNTLIINYVEPKNLDMAHCTPTQHQAGHAQGTHPIPYSLYI